MIQVNRIISVKTVSGQVVQVDGNEQLVTKSNVSLSCDGPRCGQRNGKVVSTSFVEEELTANPDSASATFRKFGQFKFNLAVKEFCSLECAEDILRDARFTSLVTAVLEAKDIPKPVQNTDSRKDAIASIAQNAEGQGIYDKFVDPSGSPNAEDLDLAVKNEISGVTAEVENETYWGI